MMRRNQKLLLGPQRANAAREETYEAKPQGTTNNRMLDAICESSKPPRTEAASPSGVRPTEAKRGAHRDGPAEPSSATRACAYNPRSNYQH